MAKCPKCGRRMAKRSCPALGLRICQLCCGTLRQKEVRCPGGCVHLAAHAPYQENRVIARESADVEDIRADERTAWLAFHIEAALHEFAAAHPSFSDRDVLLSLDYAKEKTAKGRSRIILPGAAVKPADAAGELLLEAIDGCRYSASRLVSSPGQAYATGEKIACLELVDLRVRRSRGGSRTGRPFLDALEARFRGAESRPGARKLILPGAE
jgi:hypothetical protein